MVKISVLVPVYNVEKYLEDALQSLLNQTFSDIEIICVNDGSKDNSLTLLKKFENKDSRIKIINKKNGGCGSARNRALDEAKGDYIYFFDPDDYILPNAFEELYKNITNNNSDLVIFKIAWFKDNTQINFLKPLFDFDNIFKDVDFNNFTFTYKDVKSYVLNSGFAPWSKLYRKEFLDRYDDFRFDLGVAFDDVPFHVKSMLRASKISFAPEFYYYYRYANPNSVNNTSSNGMDIMKIIDIVEVFLKNEGYFEEFKNEFYEFKINQTTMYMISSHSEDYFQLAKEILSKLNEINFDKISNNAYKKYLWVVESESYEEYELKFKIHKLKLQKIKLEKKQNKLNKKNKELKRENNNIKKLNKNLMNSKSWRITKPLRKLSNLL